MRAYNTQKNSPNFDLKKFVNTYFELPKQYATGFVANKNNNAAQHIQSLWKVLSRPADKVIDGASIIPLPNAYVVPGGRFGEVYYWDSYFTMQGLMTDNRTDIAEKIINNFAFLIDTIGHIPNGNRTYYLSRSQPPFFASMVTLLASYKGDSILVRYLPQLEKEYLFWTQGSDQLTPQNPTHRRTVLMPDGSILNRYYDDLATPRTESYKEDVAIAKSTTRPAADVYRNLRAGAESGWDFSSRWFADGKNIATIHTTELIAIDLNCLLYHLEQTIAQAYLLQSDGTNQAIYLRKAQKRAAAIQKYCWNAQKSYFGDYDFVQQKMTPHITLATAAPLFFKIATEAQAQKVAALLEKDFLKEGGFTTTLVRTGQQWDAPNAWSPLQFIAIQGLKNYPSTQKLAQVAQQRWVALNVKVYENTGKMVEKYNVYDTKLTAGGGEYPLQDGFGWTNGVLAYFLKNK
jgi:alpha,alpha-trehalase